MKMQDPPNKPQKDIPVKPDKNPDPTAPRPGGNEPGKVDPTRIDEPGKPIPHVSTILLRQSPKFLQRNM